jgi:S1-C subfamily serine protease
LNPLRAWLLAALLAFALVVAGCGGGDDDEPSSDGSQAAATNDGDDGGDSDKLIIESTDGAFNAEAVYDLASPGVVTVRSIFPAGSGGLLGQGQAGQGAGFVISDEGEIATNAHVVTDAQATGGGEPINEAKEVYVQFADRNQVAAEIVGVDPFADVALLKIEPDGIELEPLELGELDGLDVGAPVAAIGSPFGERGSLSVGVVSAIDRAIPSLTDFSIDGAIQTDASINPGNSGGPLLDAEGRVIGINQQIDTTSGGNQGVGFAVPIDLVKASLEQLRDDGEAEYPYIGVTAQALYPQLADELDLSVDSGALLIVVEGGPADEAGLCCVEEDTQVIKFQGQEINAGGDVVTAVDGVKIVGEADLPRVISRLSPGDEVPITVIRDGEEMEITVTLGVRPESVS